MSTKHLTNNWDDLNARGKKANNALVINFANSLFSYGYCFIKDEDLVKGCLRDFFIEIGSNSYDIYPTIATKVGLFKRFRHYLLEVQPQCLFEFSIEFESQQNKLDSCKDLPEKLEINLSPMEREFLYLRICENLNKKMIMKIVRTSKKKRMLFLLTWSLTKIKLFGSKIQWIHHRELQNQH